MRIRQPASCVVFAAALLPAFESGAQPDPAGPSSASEPAVSPSAATAGRIAGIVWAVETKAPIAGATITAGAFTAETGPDGRFELPAIEGPMATLQIAASGRQPLVSTVQIVPGQISTVDLPLLLIGAIDPGTVLPEVLTPRSSLPANADFSADQDRFTEVETDPERHRNAEIAAELSRARTSSPFAAEWPALSRGVAVAGGLFGAGVVGLFGGSIGEAIDPGRSDLPLGGLHGPAFGALFGSMVGTTLAVWGVSEWLELDADWPWIALGAGVGTLVGGAAAFGIAEGLGEGDSTTTLAVATFLTFQIGLALAFGEAFTPAPAGAPVATAATVEVGPYTAPATAIVPFVSLGF